ncbi:MAG: hypothetical protein A2V66_12300 [Ignavibacteria bacterium RBG_13_36_8]|nr:MAG: hypothetical protein A2V66_12300 [Ignavibacteria bacterium RBG_13_36_8]
MNKDIDNEILARYLSGESTVEGKKTVEEWLRSNPQNAKVINVLKTIWENAKVTSDPSDVQSLWEELQQKDGITESSEDTNAKTIRLKNENRFFSIFKPTTGQVLRYAAVFIILMLLPYFVYQYITSDKSGSTSDWKSLTVAYGDQSGITLEDGTKITLDAGSTIQYPEHFPNQNREVKLNGEAFFDVTHNPNKPFIVKTNNTKVKVLGTQFNIRSWEENKVEVIVADGKVSFSSEKNRSETVILERGFASELSPEGIPINPYSIDLDKSFSWMKGEITFSNTKLSEVLNQVERWYDITIILLDSGVGNEKVSVFIQKHSLDETLKLITALIDSKYEKNGKTITFSPR